MWSQRWQWVLGAVAMAGIAAEAVPVQPASVLGGFQLAGADGQWHDAAAAIQGETVLITCDKLDKPIAVCYAWAAEPAGANLYNRAGLPALPFASP
jgi:sialate O-acetylesterase